MKERANEVFETYLQEFSFSNPVLKRKKEHSYRVAENCVAIASFCNLTQEEIDILYVIGLFHDIGQFLLIERYGDKNAMDHGEQSVRILYEQGLFNKITKEKKFDSLVQKSIFAHNKFQIPEGYHEKEKTFANILRDADKLDIFYEFATRQIVIPMENAEVSKEVWETFQKGSSIEKTLVKTSLDRLLKVLSFLYNFEYKFSLFQLEKDNLLEDICEQYRHQDPKIDEVINHTEKQMKKYIRRRMGV